MGPVELLVAALLDWHTEARKSDTASDAAWNDPAPFARLRIARDEHGTCGMTAAEIVLTERHACHLASCATRRYTEWCDGGLPALAQALRRLAGSRPGREAAWVELIDAQGRTKAAMVLESKRCAGLAEQLRRHAGWLLSERIFAGASPFHEGDKVEAPELESWGLVTQVKLATKHGELEWSYRVWLDGEKPPGIWTCDFAELAPLGAS
jgi:hypothetical protein